MAEELESRVAALERAVKALGAQMGIAGAKIGLGPSQEVLEALRKESEGEIQEELSRRAHMGKPDGGEGLDGEDLARWAGSWML